MINEIIAYEGGELDEEQTIALFQQLLDTGTLYALQGHYQRTAQSLLSQGLITYPPRRDAKKTDRFDSVPFGV